jgi:hypothetical protein
MDSGVEVSWGKRKQQILVAEDESPEGFSHHVSKLFGISQDSIIFKSPAGFSMSAAHVITKARQLQAAASAASEDGSMPLFKVAIQGPQVNGGSSNSGSSGGKRKLVAPSGGGEHMKKVLQKGIRATMPRDHNGAYLNKSKPAPKGCTISGELLVCHIMYCLCRLPVYACMHTYVHSQIL